MSELLAGREGACSYTMSELLAGREGRSYTRTGEGAGDEGTARLCCWPGERGSAKLLTGQLHDCAAGWKRGGAATR